MAKSHQVDIHYADQAHFCYLNKGLKFDYILKIERINEWYTQLMHDLGLTEVAMHGWPAEDNCFFSAPDAQCLGKEAVEDKYGGVHLQD